MKLFVVVVLYKMLPRESPTVQSLIASGYNSDQFSILVWDNTPGGQQLGDAPPGVRYYSAPNNPGLSTAYNYAMELGSEEGCDWMLTLDQDSVLPGEFLAELQSLIQQLQSTDEVAAVVPRVLGDGRHLSPFRFVMNALPRPVDDHFIGMSSDAVYAVNSAATVRISAVQKVGGYSPLFPLDISDLDLFHRLSRANKKIYVASDLVVQHEFSLLKKHKRMSVSRYDAQLLDECAFWDMSMGWLGRLERLVRLAGRFCKDLPNPDAAPFRKRTIAEIWRRIRIPRKLRIEQWRCFATERASRAIT